MRKTRAGSVLIKGFVLIVGLGPAYQAMAQDATTHYPKMAQIDQYLMADRDAEIAFSAQCRAGLDFTRCRGISSWKAWF